jgi:hypothetical protein
MNGDKLFIVDTPSSCWYLGTTASQHQTNSNTGMIETDILTIPHFLHALLIDMYDELKAPSV